MLNPVFLWKTGKTQQCCTNCTAYQHIVQVVRTNRSGINESQHVRTEKCVLELLNALQRTVTRTCWPGYVTHCQYTWAVELGCSLASQDWPSKGKAPWNKGKCNIHKSCMNQNHLHCSFSHTLHAMAQVHITHIKSSIIQIKIWAVFAMPVSACQISEHQLIKNATHKAAERFPQEQLAWLFPRSSPQRYSC